MKFPTQGLYAITQPEHKADNVIISEVEAVLKGGADVIQYRDKREIKTQALAYELLCLCRDFNVPLIINDDIKLAKNLGADGVHLGRDDGSVTHARELLGENIIIGVSCYNDLNKAELAAQQGVDYVAFGRFFPSGSKPLAGPAEISTLLKAKLSIHIPIVAIGGILPENGAELLAAGADLLAVIGGVFNDNPYQSSQQYKKLFSAN